MKFLADGHEEAIASLDSLLGLLVTVVPVVAVAVAVAANTLLSQ